MLPEVQIIVGPTASGKSRHALSFHNAEIINADSVQLFGDLSILTARPTEMPIPHHLYGILDAKSQPNVYTWRAQALATIQEILSRGHMPVVVGGTGLYVQALMEGLPSIPDIDPSIEAEVSSWNDTTLRHYADPEVLARFKDRRRIERAVMVQRSTGKSVFYWHAQKTPPPFTFRIQLILPERSLLLSRIRARLEDMVNAGVVEEVRALLPDALHWPIARAIGFREIAAHIQEGKLPLSQVLEQVECKTRQYAKRQSTWFRHQLPKEGVIIPGCHRE